ncbi:hypothetical protein [Agrobacterium vaccinii]|uniref:hypothetical protein n=1 Tax=Agrobacterium vaccinii TaxID=2735528 RepID=UPI001E424749|nr:hypothetical protein [Agrobacterium vaccinii]UHS56838.1 hypothetical protein HRS00_08500 [Agrobacterium vaccinii]
MLTTKQRKKRFASYIGGVTNPAAPANTVAPAITGTAQVGQTLTANAGTFTGTPAPTIDRQWIVGGFEVPGAFGLTFVPRAQDVGKTVRVRTRAQSLAGKVSVLSAPTAAVVAA